MNPSPRRSPRKSSTTAHSSSTPVPRNNHPTAKSFQVSSVEKVSVNKTFKVVLFGPPKAQQRPRIGKSSRSSFVNGKIITLPVIYNPSQKEQRQMKAVLKEVVQPHIEASNQPGCRIPESCLNQGCCEVLPPTPEVPFSSW